MLVAPRFVPKINPRVIRELAELPVSWGPVGLVTYKRTYAREVNGRLEDWHETVERGCNGLLEIGGVFDIEQIEQLAYYWHQLKGCPAGRPIWQLGTDTVQRVGGDSLQNCWLVACNHPIDPFTFTFNELMLGGGVGFNIEPEYVYEIPAVRYAPRVENTNSFDCDYIVTDNREGWVELLSRVLSAFFITGRPLRYCTRGLRAKGSPIRGFGGVASGPEPLTQGITEICRILGSRHGQKLRPTHCLDILNIIAWITVAGNVRRSAEIAIGSYQDQEYLEAKDWSKKVIPPWRQNSNNSVNAPDTVLLPESFWRGYMPGNGEPYGLVNLDLCRQMGRLRDGEGYRPDPGVVGCNPCVPDDTWVHTTEGPKQVCELIGKPFHALVDGYPYASGKVGFFPSGEKEVFRVTTNRGFTFDVTKNHEIETPEFGWMPLSDLNPGDEVKLHNHRTGYWQGQGSRDEGWLIGSLLGDGMAFENSDQLSYWGSTKAVMHVYATSLLHRVFALRRDCGSGQPNEANDRIDVSCKQLLERATDFGLNVKEKTLSSLIEQTSALFYSGFLSGWFDADGSVQGYQTKGVSVRLSSSILGNLKIAQRMLARLGIISTIYPERRPEGPRLLPNGREGADHELVIARDNLQVFAARVNFIDIEKAKKLDEILSRYVRRPNQETFTTEIISIKSIGVKPVYDCKVSGAYNFDGNGVKLHNCGEANLESHEACNLTEIFLPNIADVQEFGQVASLLLRAAKAIGGLKYWHPRTNEVVNRNRRIGIGVTGFHQAQHLADAHIFDAVYNHLEESDVILSKELNCPQSIKLTVVKPSGTLSLLAGVTPGAHAAYAPYYIRRITLAANSPLVAPIRAHGYPVVPKINIDGSYDFNTLIAEFPCKMPTAAKYVAQYSAIEQLETQRFLQIYWADQSVSQTIYYRKEELPAIRAWLREHYAHEVKTTSFLLHSEHGFKQAPYEEITEAQFHELRSRCRPIQSLEIEGELDIDLSTECGSGGCPVR